MWVIRGGFFSVDLIAGEGLRSLRVDAPQQLSERTEYREEEVALRTETVPLKANGFTGGTLVAVADTAGFTATRILASLLPSVVQQVTTRWKPFAILFSIPPALLMPRLGSIGGFSFSTMGLTELSRICDPGTFIQSYFKNHSMYGF